MCEVGDDFIFIHIPKTGGMGIRETLRLYTNTVVRSPFHGIPTNIDYHTVFTFVRHPAFWLRSFWTNRERERWSFGGGDGDWRWVTEELCPLREDTCNDFIYRVAEERRGIVGEFFQRFFVHGIHIGRTEFLEHDLQAIIPQIERFSAPVNVGVGKQPISIKSFDAISATEPWVVNNFYIDEWELVNTIWERELCQ